MIRTTSLREDVRAIVQGFIDRGACWSDYEPTKHAVNAACGWDSDDYDRDTYDAAVRIIEQHIGRPARGRKWRR